MNSQEEKAHIFLIQGSHCPEKSSVSTSCTFFSVLLSCLSVFIPCEQIAKRQ